MTPSKEVATTGAAALGISEEDYEALLKGQDEEFDSDSVQTPILKICQPLTKQVVAEEAEPGQFLNTLTGETFDGAAGIDFIVAYYQKGRFYSDKKSGRGLPAFGDTIPESWGDLIGEQFVGTRFDEHPDAEETFKARVNNKEIEWGSGPAIATTHNYTGLLVTDEGLQPVRLGLMRTQMDGVRKINTLKRGLMRNQPFFNKVFHFTTEKKVFAKGPTWLLKPTLVRDTDADERLQALELATATRAGRVREAGEVDGDTPTAPASAPDAKGGLGV